jgi:hypothetical protein
MVKTPYPPPKRKKMGNRVYRLVDTTKSTQEVIIMAKATKKAPVVTDDELEELDALEELDDLDEDDEDETVADAELVEDDDEDEDDEEVEPVAKKTKRQAKNDASAPTTAKPSRSRTTDGKVGTREIAEAAGVDGRTLRMVLRKHQVPKDPETGRYEWDSMKAKPVKQILKWIENGEAQDIKTAALDKLKADKAAKKAAKDDEAPAVKSKKGKKNKKAKVAVVEDDDDE